MLDERASPSASHAGGEGSDETDSQHTADKQSVGSNESKGVGFSFFFCKVPRYKS